MRIRRRVARRRVAACVSVIVALAVCPNAFADDILVMSAGNTTPALLRLAPQFERSAGHKSVTVATEMGVGQTHSRVAFGVASRWTCSSRSPVRLTI